MTTTHTHPSLRPTCSRHRGCRPLDIEAFEACEAKAIPNRGVGTLGDQVLPQLRVLVGKAIMQARVPFVVLEIHVTSSSQQFLDNLLVVVLHPSGGSVRDRQEEDMVARIQPPWV